jgi:DNA (cytosine-5)-methyltransferase 1
MKILNLFAGIGGNRTLWGDEHEITAVEWDSGIALLYQRRFPNDTVIVGDAYTYLEDHFHEFPIVWLSIPCTTHTVLTKTRAGRRYSGYDPDVKVKIPDFKLYGTIAFLQEIYRGNWVVENVKPFYTPMYPPTSKVGRHYLWSNVPIPKIKKRVKTTHIDYQNRDLQQGLIDRFIDIVLPESWDEKKKWQVVNNCVHPVEGKWILDHLIGNKTQTVLF